MSKRLEVMIDRRSMVVTEETSIPEIIEFVAEWKPGNYPVIQRATQAILRNLASVRPGERAGMGIA